MANPLFNDSALQRAGTEGGFGTSGQGAAYDTMTGTAPPPPIATTAGRTMTYGGTVSAAALMLAFLTIAGYFGWQLVTESTAIDLQGNTVVTANIENGGIMWVGMLAGFGLAILTAFKPMLARWTSIPYALCYGVAVGAISHLYDARFEGIVIQAILATMGVFLVMLVLYSLRILRATPRFVKGVIAATLGICLMYLVGFVASLFGAGLMFWNSPSLLGIGISVVIVIVAALNLIIDFDVIERGVNERWPAAMEWYGAFALTVTLVWLYLEMLRLISKLRQ